MRIDAAGGPTTVPGIGDGNSKIRAPGVTERAAETVRGIAFDESLGTAMLPKAR